MLAFSFTGVWCSHPYWVNNVGLLFITILHFSENAVGQWKSCLSFHLCDINQNIQPLTMKYGRSMLLVFSVRMGKFSAQTWCKLLDPTRWTCHLLIRRCTFVTFYHLHNHQLQNAYKRPPAVISFLESFIQGVEKKNLHHQVLSPRARCIDS